MVRQNKKFGLLLGCFSYEKNCSTCLEMVQSAVRKNCQRPLASGL
jgi:hypothetical protein